MVRGLRDINQELDRAITEVQRISSNLRPSVLDDFGLVTALMTAFYMWRLMNMTFYGRSHVRAEVAARVHESPPVRSYSITAPLWARPHASPSRIGVGVQ